MSDESKSVKATIEEKILKGLVKIYERVQPISYKTSTINFFQPKGGQLQFSVAGPTYKDPEKSFDGKPAFCWPQKMGAVFIEGAPPIPNSERLDWANKKIVFALGDKDIGEIIWGLTIKQPEIKLIHSMDETNRKNSKTFRINREADWNGTPQWSLSLEESKDGERNKVSMFIKGPDLMRLKLLLEHSIPYIIGAHRA